MVVEPGEMIAKLLTPTLNITVLHFSMKMTSPVLPNPELYKKLLLLLADCLRSNSNFNMYQSYLTMALVFLAVKLKSVFLAYLTGLEETKLPSSEIGVTVIGSTRMPPSIIDQINFLPDGWSYPYIWIGIAIETEEEGFITQNPSLTVMLEVMVALNLEQTILVG